MEETARILYTRTGKKVLIAADVSAMTRLNHWQEHWLDLDCDGLPLREWCTKLTKEPGFAYCKVCKLTLKYVNIGLRALRDHGKTKKHLDNLKAKLVKAVKSSKKKSRPVPSPVVSVRRKSTPNKSIKRVKCSNNNQLHRQVFTPDSIHFKRPSCQVIDTTHGPVPYYQLLNCELRNAFIPVYPCCYCPEEFESKQLLHEHQATCIMKPPVLQAVIPSDTDSMRFIAEGQAPPSLSPLLSDSPIKTSSEFLSFNGQMAQPSRKDLIAALGLLPKKKARQVSQRRRNTECESIDLDAEFPMTPTTPGTSRTPKLLISHLSRESSEQYRRRLSFNVDGKVERDKDGLGNVGEGNGDENRADEQGRRVNAGKSLYNLDVTSPLGQFVIKHFKGDPSLHILSDIESHCLTSSPAPKNSSISRLRVRNAAYPITFRGYSGKFSNYAHEYKFNKKQVKEFMKTANTGLNKNSRRIYRRMTPCKVVLKHVTKADLRHWIPSQNQLTIDLKPLSAAEIAFWTMPKPPPSMESVPVFPNGLKFTSHNVNSILGLRTKQDATVGGLRTSSLTLSNFVSEEICAELVQNRKVLYRSLLSDCSKNEDCLSENETSNRGHSVSYSILRRMLGEHPNNCPSTRPLSNSNSCVNPTCMFASSKEKTNFPTPTQGSHLTALNTNKGKAIRPKRAKTLDETNFTNSLVLELTPVDSSKAPGNVSLLSRNFTGNKRKRPFSNSNERGAQSSGQGRAKKQRGGLSVKVRPSTEGDEIKNCPSNSVQVSSYRKTAQNLDKIKKMPCKNVPHKASSSKRVSVSRLSSRTKTIRSSPGVPSSSKGRGGRKKEEKKRGYLSGYSHGRQRSKSARSSPPKRKRDLISKNTEKLPLKKERHSEQRKTKPRNSKSRHKVIPKTQPSKFKRAKLDSASERSREAKLPSEPESFKRKLNAAGLVKRVTVSNPSNSRTTGRRVEPIVPILTKLAQNLTTTSVNSDTCVSNGSLDTRIPPAKPASENLVLRKANSHTGASSVAETSRSRLKDEKHKNFMLWLRTLRTGNIV